MAAASRHKDIAGPLPKMRTTALAAAAYESHLYMLKEGDYITVHQKASKTSDCRLDKASQTSLKVATAATPHRTTAFWLSIMRPLPQDCSFITLTNFEHPNSALMSSIKLLMRGSMPGPWVPSHELRLARQLNSMLCALAQG